MKKFLALALILIMCMGSLAACGTTEQPAEPTPTTAPTTAPTQAPVEETVSDLVNAKNYLFTMYKDQTEATPVDYTVVGVVNIGGVLFPIEWTVDNDTVKIIPGDDKMVTIDVDDKNPEEVTYVLTATLKDDKGNTESCSFTHRVPAAIILDAGMSYGDIVDAAYTLEDGLAMDGTFRLYGTITKIDTAWSPDYKNITVTIAVAGKEDKPIMCYRLKGEGAENLAVGDAITVEGILKNYKGTIEFDAGCELIGYGEHKDYTALLDAAYTLEDGLAMQEPCTMSGYIHKIDTAYSTDYKNITVSITVNGVEDKPIMCYRLQGEGCENLAIGDYITVTGIIKNYKGTIEFDAKCTLDAVVKAPGSDEPVEEAPKVDPTGMSAAEILDAAYALADGDSFGAPCTLTGVITEVNSAYSEQYGNITVTIVVDGKEDKKIECFRLIGDGIADLAVGDTITVTGTILNYGGKIEFNAKCTLDAVVKAEGGEAPAETPTETPAPTEAPVETPAPTEAPAQVDPTGMSAAEILDAAYALADGETFGAPCTLTGVINEVNTAYNEQYGNITVTIVVDGKEDKKIECYRLAGDGVADLAVGDTITVTGIMKNYKGKIEFDAKCTLDAVVKAEVPTEAPATDWTSQYTGDYTAYTVAPSEFAGCTAGATVTFDFARLGGSYTYWNFTFINMVDGWPKLLDAKYYIGEKPAFSEWDFIDVNDTSVTSYTVTLSAEAVAELAAGTGLGIQVYGIVPYNITVTPADGSAPAKEENIDWTTKYTGDYTAYTVATSEFADCTAGATVTFDFARLGGSYTYWNFTFVNMVDGWPKLLDAKYYIGEKPAFSEWDFIDVNDTNVTSYTVTLSAEAVAELAAGTGLGIQVYGIVPHNITVTPVK